MFKDNKMHISYLRICLLDKSIPKYLHLNQMSENEYVVK